jgi:hypothetical protein
LAHDEQSDVSITIATPAVVTWNKPGGHGFVAGSTFRFTQATTLPGNVSTNTEYYVIAAGLTSTTFQFALTEAGTAINTTGSAAGLYVKGWPRNTTYFRRIGSIIRSGGTILPFLQVGRKFVHTTPIVDVSAVATGTSAQTKTLTVPVGIRVEAFGSAFATASTHVYFSDLAQVDLAPSGTVGGFTLATNSAALWGPVFTNASGQIRTRSSVGMNMTLVTYGWIDLAGVDLP